MSYVPNSGFTLPFPWILKLIDTRDLDFIIGSDEQFNNENITKMFKQCDKE